MQFLTEAQIHVLASQCNDAYWHGVFGRLYAPHLRSALLRNLIQAEVLLDKVEGLGGDPSLRVKQGDFDVDGQEEILLEHPAIGMVIRPADGTVSSLRFKPVHTELVNSLRRRPEAYHAQVRKHVGSREPPKEGPASIHDMVLSKEANLEALLLTIATIGSTCSGPLFFLPPKGGGDFNAPPGGKRTSGWRAVETGRPAGEIPGVVRLESSAPIQIGDCLMQVAAQKTITTRYRANRVGSSANLRFPRRPALAPPKLALARNWSSTFWRPLLRPLLHGQRCAAAAGFPRRNRCLEPDTRG